MFFNKKPKKTPGATWASVLQDDVAAVARILKAKDDGAEVNEKGVDLVFAFAKQCLFRMAAMNDLLSFTPDDPVNLLAVKKNWGTGDKKSSGSQTHVEVVGMSPMIKAKMCETLGISEEELDNSINALKNKLMGKHKMSEPSENAGDEYTSNSHMVIDSDNLGRKRYTVYWQERGKSPTSRSFYGDEGGADAMEFQLELMTRSDLVPYKHE